MPRFQRTCSNPFHETWSKREDEKIVNLRARGLVSLGTIFQKYIEQEMGKESTPGHGIKNLRTTCLNECFKKRKFSRLLSNNQADELKIKVERQVCRNTEMLQFNFDRTQCSTISFLWAIRVTGQRYFHAIHTLKRTISLCI